MRTIRTPALLTCALAAACGASSEPPPGVPEGAGRAPLELAPTLPAGCPSACAAGELCVEAVCVDEPDAPHLIAPLSSSATTSRPTFRWRDAADATDSVIEVCRDRGCLTLVARLSTANPALDAPLAPGAYFWRGFGRRGRIEGRRPSPTYEFWVLGPNGGVTDGFPLVPDFDGDGRADLAVSQGDTLTVFALKPLATSGSTLVVRQRVALPSPGLALHTVSAGDVNGDGFSDAVSVRTRPPSAATHLPTPEVILLLGSSAGLGSAPRVLTLTDFGAPTAIAAVGDLDGDGFADVVVAHSGDRRASWRADATVTLVLGGPTPFASSARLSIPKVFGDIYAVEALGDVNGDRLADFAVTTQDANSKQHLFVVYGANDRAPPRPPQRLGQLSHPARLGDFNGDGYGDLLARRPTVLNQTLSNNRVMQEAAPVLFWGSSTGFDRRRFEVRDYPMATARPSRYGGNPCEARPVSSDLCALPLLEEYRAVGDLNGDGVEDLIAHAPTFRPEAGSTVRLIVGQRGGANLGTSALSLRDPREPTPPVVFGAQAVMLGDLDGDGLAELAVHARSRDAYRLTPEYNSPTFPELSGETYVYRGEPQGLAPVPSWRVSAPSTSSAGRILGP